MRHNCGHRYFWGHKKIKIKMDSEERLRERERQARAADLQRSMLSRSKETKILGTQDWRYIRACSKRFYVYTTFEIFTRSWSSTERTICARCKQIPKLTWNPGPVPPQEYTIWSFWKCEVFENVGSHTRCCSHANNVNLSITTRTVWIHRIHRINLPADLDVLVKFHRDFRSVVQSHIY